MPDFQSIENTLNELPDIRVQGLLKRRTETLEEFAERFISHWNRENETIFVENRRVQTRPDKRRSMDDLYKIFKYYYPDITLRDVARVLHVYLPENMEGFRSSPCSVIRKRVYYYDGRRSVIYDRGHRDQHGLTFNQWAAYAS